MTRYAVLSVTDKTGLVDFAKGLGQLGFKLLSTGGSAKVLRDSGLEVMDVSEFTGSPEILDGRVKTLHPKIHGGILFDRENPAHVAEANRLGIVPIELIVANLYDFAKATSDRNIALEKAIESIDIGGPTMLRAAAKNFRSCAPIIDPADYDMVLAELKSSQQLSENTRLKLATKTFAAISAYDASISAFFNHKNSNATASTGENHELPKEIAVTFDLKQSLRYGENPHQHAGAYVLRNQPATGLFDPSTKILQGKELSYNNMLDLDAALMLIWDLRATPASVIIKHTNPCGAAAFNGSLKDVYLAALASDPTSAFGGIVALNRTVEADLAQELSKTFLECIAAPSFAPAAREILAAKKNLRLLEINTDTYGANFKLQMRSLSGATLIQQCDRYSAADQSKWQSVTDLTPSDQARKDLEFAMIVAKHVKSNAIVLAKNGRTIGVGAGQMSRIDAVKIAFEKAAAFGHDAKGSVLASDAFFPFRDCVDTAASHGVAAIIQPGGSMRDEESIVAAREHHIAMVFTGTRHFKH